MKSATQHTALVSILILTLLSNFAYAQSYSLSIVGSPASAINTQGQMEVWRGGVASSLNPLSGTAFTPGVTGFHPYGVTGINDSGSTSGTVFYYPDTDGRRAVRWDGGVATQLNPLDGNSSESSGINNSGQVVGTSSVASGSEMVSRATIWNGTVPTALGILNGGRGSSGAAINNVGQVAGVTFLQNEIHATIWNGTTPTDLGRGAWGGTFSAAQGINDGGQVVGYSYEGDGFSGQHATLWSGGVATGLKRLIGDMGSSAIDINNNGLIVGSTTFRLSSGYDQRATLWVGSDAIDLNMFAIGSGWVLQDSIAINDNGYIFGSAHNQSLGQSANYVLAPVVPLPSAAYQLLLGLAPMAWFARRLRLPRNK